MSNNNNRNSKQDQRLSALETDVKWIKDELGHIRNNELDSIEKQIDCIHKKLNSRPSWLMSSIITGLVAIIVALITYVL